MAAQTSAPDPTPNLPVPITEQALAQYSGMLDLVPESGADAWDAILGAIAGAQSIEDLDAPWQADGLADMADRRLTVLSIKKAPSEYQGGWDWYLIVDAIDYDTGEKVVTTTGSTSVVAQLIRAHALGAFPLEVVVRKAVKPTKNGFYPMHLQIIRDRKRAG